MNRKKSIFSQEHLDYPHTGEVVPKDTMNFFEKDSEENMISQINSSIQEKIQGSIETLADDLKTELNFVLQENAKRMQGLIENQISSYQKKVDDSVNNMNHLLNRCLESIHSLVLKIDHFTQQAEKKTFKSPDHLNDHNTVTRLLHILLNHENRVSQRNEILEKIASEYFITDMDREVSDEIIDLKDNLASLYSSVSKIQDDFMREGKEVPISVQITTEKMQDAINEFEQFIQWHRNKRLNVDISISLREDDGIYPLEDIASALGDVVMKLKTPEKYFGEKFDMVIKNLIELINFLDEISDSHEITVRLGELIHECERVHLREVCPNEKETFSPVLHEVEGIDAGPRDQILKVKRRGFTYRGNLVQKPRVIIGGKTQIDYSVK
ncbi:MAG: hypothetical protein SVY10_18230 [Thermodesulfobacteriota bacterium]|nr:hypothetical protein [Thermodesulfobacteriota bacterium]